MAEHTFCATAEMPMDMRPSRQSTYRGLLATGACHLRATRDATAVRFSIFGAERTRESSDWFYSLARQHTDEWDQVCI